MHVLKSIVLLLALAWALGACDEAPEKGAESSDLDMLGWQRAALGEVALKKSDSSKSIGDGDCRDGTVAKLHVTLCEFKDAVGADSAKGLGIAQIGANTGAALVRGRFLLVVADLDKVDVHGKVLNQIAKIFLKPPPAISL